MRVTERLLRKGIEGTLTPFEYTRLSERAGGWAFCAIGENRAALKRRGFYVDKYNGPNHSFLVHLGARFCGLVNRGQFGRALQLYNKIKRIALGEVRVKGGAY